MDQSPPPERRRRWLSWVVSLAAGALFLWVASTRLRLWPEDLAIPRPELLWLALAVHLPYAAVRALRLGYMLDPIVSAAATDPRRTLSRPLLYGSGLVSFLVLLVLPLKLGELSRPLLLARGQEPGVRVTESLAAVATERIVDGLLICTMLFGGLALAQDYAPGTESMLGDVRRIGQGMLVLFGGAFAVLMLAARDPQRAASLTARLPGVIGARGSALMLRFAAPAAALWDLRRTVPLLGWSLVYWAITTAQLWLVLEACGVALGPAQAAAIVAIVGLSIQLPGGPVQAGTFQVGTALALGLFLGEAQVEGPGSVFTAVMYVLQFVGAGLVALPGAWLLARHAQGGRETRQTGSQAASEA